MINLLLCKDQDLLKILRQSPDLFLDGLELSEKILDVYQIPAVLRDDAEWLLAVAYVGGHLDGIRSERKRRQNRVTA